MGCTPTDYHRHKVTQFYFISFQIPLVNYSSLYIKRRVASEDKRDSTDRFPYCLCDDRFGIGSVQLVRTNGGLLIVFPTSCMMIGLVLVLSS